jgi:hypothetical protein
VNESTAYPALLDAAIRATGCTPRIVSGDRGISLSAVYEHNTRRGIATVAPYRRSNGYAPLTPPKGPINPDTGFHLWDEYGDPVCQHCGSPGTHVGFNDSDGKPRVLYRCSVGTFPACETTKRISCSHDWTALVPLGRNSDAYTAMTMSHKNSEHVHNDMRSRYNVGAKTLADRPKRIGRLTRQLRASAALVIEWIMVTIRLGWANVPRVASQAQRPSSEVLATKRGEFKGRQAKLAKSGQRATGPPG